MHDTLGVRAQGYDTPAGAWSQGLWTKIPLQALGASRV